MGAILVPDGYQTHVLERWAQAGVEIGRRPGDVVHWVNVKSHSQRMHLVRTIASLEHAHLVGVVFSKWDTPNTSADGVQQPDRLYNWVLRLMVERLSWFAGDRGDSIRMTFGQVKGLDPRKLEAYLKYLEDLDTNITWQALSLPPRIDTPANRRMLQVADTVCGALGAAFEWDVYGNNEVRYLHILRPRLWVRGGNLSSYGLKVSPFPHPRHEWLNDFCRQG